ncbi:MAG: hypothetical protein WBP81_38195 [Solirubrobacteraceae bacterium]
MRQRRDGLRERRRRRPTRTAGTCRAACAASDETNEPPAVSTHQRKEKRNGRAEHKHAQQNRRGPRASGRRRRGPQPHRDRRGPQRNRLRGRGGAARRGRGPPAVDQAFSNQIGELDFPAEIATADPTASCTFAVGPGFKWGCGLLLNTHDIPGCRRAGSGAWAGLLNTHFWVDRTTGITAAIYSQFLPFGPEPAMRMYQDFEAALYASL